jgi:hypothetical protein
MGKHNGPYNADFPQGTQVQIKSREFLEEFKKTWKWHHPFNDVQLDYGGRIAVVYSFGYYFGADELYWLEDIPGTWHEACLDPVDVALSPEELK